MGVWFAAVAYGDRDYGEGPTRLFARSYDHEPTEAEVTHDAFVEAVPDWKERYPGYTLHAAAYEWEGTLHDAPIVVIVGHQFPDPSRTILGEAVGRGSTEATRCTGGPR